MSYKIKLHLSYKIISYIIFFFYNQGLVRVLTLL